MGHMEAKTLMVWVGLACLLCNGSRSKSISHENSVWEKDFPKQRSVKGALDFEFLHHLAGSGPEKLPIEIFEIGKTIDEERREVKLSESEVDEETIRKAEKMADTDLLNGLNRILRKNETLKDIFRTENVDETP